MIDDLLSSLTRSIFRQECTVVDWLAEYDIHPLEHSGPTCINGKDIVQAIDGNGYYGWPILKNYYTCPWPTFFDVP